MTVRLLADENVNGAIVRGLLRRNPGIDVVRVQGVWPAEAHAAVADLCPHDAQNDWRWPLE